VEVVSVPGMRLSFRERTEICRRLACREALAEVARALRRPTSTISREVARNGGRDGYQAEAAQQRRDRAARRPKPFKLECHPRLGRQVEAKLALEWSPEQIAGWLRRGHPGDPRWWVSPQAIYHSIYIQGRGGLRDELRSHLRQERHRARHERSADGRGRLKGMVSIAQRPPEADDRRVPGHWEGDLLLGAPAGRSHIATLVERHSRLVLLIKLGERRDAESVKDALEAAVKRLPRQLARSLTWDQGKEMARHIEFTIATGIQVYFCDPASPWQRGSNENTNGLLRQYWPKDVTDFNTLTQADLDQVAWRLNTRPRKTLDYRTPAEVYRDAVAMTT
jgi:IS30 family transposase